MSPGFSTTTRLFPKRDTHTRCPPHLLLGGTHHSFLIDLERTLPGFLFELWCFEASVVQVCDVPPRYVPRRGNKEERGKRPKHRQPEERLLSWPLATDGAGLGLGESWTSELAEYLMRLWHDDEWTESGMDAGRVRTGWESFLSSPRVKNLFSSAKCQTIKPSNMTSFNTHYSSFTWLKERSWCCSLWCGGSDDSEGRRIFPTISLGTDSI